MFGQTTGSVTVFSENGDKFYLLLDGVKQNDSARSNIRIQDLTDLYYSAKIIFEDATLWPLSKTNLYISDGEDIMRDATYKIHREGGNRAKLSFFSMLPVQQDYTPSPGMFVLHYGQPSISETALPKKTPNRLHDASLGSLTIFSQNGDNFFLYLDGVKQNDIPQSKIRIEKVTDLYYNAKIVFNNSSYAPVSKNVLFISDGDDNLMDASYRIRRDKTGKPRLNFYSMKNIQPAFIVPPGMSVYNLATPGSDISLVTSKKSSPRITGVITNIKITDPSSSSISSDRTASAGNPTKKSPDKTMPATVVILAGNKAVDIAKHKDTTTLKTDTRCEGWPMAEGDLAAAKKRIEQTGKEEEMLAAAQDLVTTNCLMSNQVSEVCGWFKLESSKLAFAKYAYKYTLDRKNYAEVSKAFTLETSRKELNRFINGG